MSRSEEFLWFRLLGLALVIEGIGKFLAGKRAPRPAFSVARRMARRRA